MENQPEPTQVPPSAEAPGPTEAKDLGFGSKLLDKQVRMVNSDGTANVLKLGRSWFRPYDFYLKLISMPWWKFNLMVIAAYLSLNLFFSSMYVLIGVEQLAGMEGVTIWEKFWEAFFFSSQTITTLGYGRIAPVGSAASTVAALESLVGLLGFALATGLLYGRFSRAEAKIIFSTHAVVAPYEGGKALMIRLANERSSQLIEAEAVLTLAYYEPGSDRRDFARLDLETDKITFLAMSWTVVHPIVEGSPMWGWTQEDINLRRLELILMIKAFDDSFGTTVYQRRSYIVSEIKWGEKFQWILGTSGDAVTVDLSRLSESAPVPMP